ncbi:Alpha/beta hydrolase family protein [Salinimicrobium catena]|uniref:Alpha/beta hydrolase family protein n=1 Tax=Salinimicrobium catena TaxID=390640 RepID=A0A1H5MZX3_9FLAO|nr:alpha/beta hydrolase [Salinimicrobium catena]SDL33459.1 Alpha/beta hydrolase family protein [Salinimicrobium catena]SEE94853.1 Alpha/beta hydrolase family protein [Salinimicrobium catena]
MGNSLQKPGFRNIELKEVTLQADLIIPENSVGLVIFSHGSGSSRLSKRNIYVASQLQKKGLSTLLFDLLTEEEDKNYSARFNIDLLTKRLVEVIQWLNHEPWTAHLNKSLFGASTGAASALLAAAQLGEEIKAVVSRGGRVDMAGDKLGKVVAPTLFIVGGDDDVVLQLNEKAFVSLNCEKQLEIIPGASHLFEEPGKMEEVARLSAEWFSEYL